jgi:hypothetical protein
MQHKCRRPWRISKHDLLEANKALSRDPAYIVTGPSKSDFVLSW